MRSCRECCYAAPTGANLYCSMNDCYVGELTCDDFEPIVKAKTNADRIRAMSDEELAQFFHDSVACGDCPVGDSKCKRAFALCKNTALAWLKSPVEVQDG